MQENDKQARSRARAEALKLVDMLNQKCGPTDHLPAYARPDALFAGLAQVIYEMGQHAKTDRHPPFRVLTPPRLCGKPDISTSDSG